MKTHCKRGHLRTPENVSTNGTCRECTKLACKEYYINNKEEHNEASRKWRKDHLVRLRAIINSKNGTFKLEVLTHYGPHGKLRCCWPSCRVKDVDVLSLDHIQDDGYRHRNGSGNRITGINMYRWIRAHGFPKGGYQTLCGSHQLKKLCIQRRAERKEN